MLLFALLALLTAASVLWSIVPELTYVEAGRTFAYVAVFAAAVASARLTRRAAPQLLLGLLIGAIIPVLYALASRVWPGALAENEVSNRLGQPFDYWNAVGCVAAIAVPICLWLGSRRTGNPILRVLAYPAMGVSVVAILLTQSRGAAAAAAVGAIAWFVLVPLRLRSLPVLLLPLGAGAAVSAWALSKDPFTKAFQPLTAKEAVAGDFGALVLLMIVLLILFGAAVETGAERRAPSARMRRRIGIAAVTVACLVPLAAFTSVAFSERGIGDRIDELTSETQVSPGEGGGRVFGAASSRGKYWREAFRVFDDRPLRGGGRRSVREGAAPASHRRVGDPARTRMDPADDGRPRSHRPRGHDPALPRLGAGRAERHRPGSPTAPARRGRRHATTAARLGRGSHRRGHARARAARVRHPVAPRLDLVHPGARCHGAHPGRIPRGARTSRGGRRSGRAGRCRAADPVAPGAGRIVTALVAVVTALLLAWAIWQPEASDRATNEALALLDEKKFDQALAKTDDAEDLNPLTPDPLLVRAAIETAANHEADAQQSLERAVLLFPGDPQTWYRLAAFQLGTLDAPEQALDTIRGALYLDPHSKAGAQIFLDARARAAREVRQRDRPRPQRVARTSSVPERRLSDSTSKPSSRSSRRRERRVKKRR